MRIECAFLLKLSKNHNTHLTFCISIQFSFVIPLTSSIQIRIIYLILLLYQCVNFLTVVLIFLGGQVNQSFNIYFIIILFAIDFATEFPSFRVDPKPDKYSSIASDPILPTRHDEAPGPEVENEDEEDIENLCSCSLLSEGGLQHPPSIFNRHNSRSWDYAVMRLCYRCSRFLLSVPANYKKVCQAIQEKFGYQPKL